MYLDQRLNLDRIDKISLLDTTKFGLIFISEEVLDFFRIFLKFLELIFHL